jgi:hypothetical protein
MKSTTTTQAISIDIGCPNCIHFSKDLWDKKVPGILYCKSPIKPRVTELIDSLSCQDFQRSTETSNS